MYTLEHNTIGIVSTFVVEIPKSSYNTSLLDHFILAKYANHKT